MWLDTGQFVMSVWVCVCVCVCLCMHTQFCIIMFMQNVFSSCFDDSPELMNSEIDGIPRRKAELYTKMEMWVEANNEYRSLILRQ